MRSKFKLCLCALTATLGGCAPSPLEAPTTTDDATLRAIHAQTAGAAAGAACVTADGTRFDVSCLRERGIVALLIDSDRDGLANYEELERGLDPADPTDGPDIDGDGIPNGEDDDVDGDGVPNRHDFDIDGDGLLNGLDPDIDADGLIGADDPDEDGDGMSNRWDLDADGDGDEDDDGGGDDDDGGGDDDDETNLENLIGRLRDGTITQQDRSALAREIAEALKAPQEQEEFNRALSDAIALAGAAGRAGNPGDIPAGIAAVDAIYDQLSKTLEQVRRAKRLLPGDSLPESDLREVVTSFAPRAKAIGEMAQAFPALSIRELGGAVTNLTVALGSGSRALDFASAVKDVAASEPLFDSDEDALEKLMTSAALLGDVFDDADPAEMLSYIRGLDQLVDSKEALFDLVRQVRRQGERGRDLDDAYADVHDPLVDDESDEDGDAPDNADEDEDGDDAGSEAP